MIIMCGGCGTTDPAKRCLGCLHDFGSEAPLAFSGHKIVHPGADYVADLKRQLAASQDEVVRLTREVAEWKFVSHEIVHPGATVTDDQVERGAIGAFAFTGPSGMGAMHGDWTKLGEDTKTMWRGIARATLEAAALPDKGPSNG